MQGRGNLRNHKTFFETHLKNIDNPLEISHFKSFKSNHLIVMEVLISLGVGFTKEARALSW